MIEARATPTQRLLAARYAEIHRKFFPPVLSRSIVEAAPKIAPAFEPPPLPQPPVKFIGIEQTMLRMAIIRRAVCKAFKISKLDLLSARRSADIVLPRHVFSYLVLRFTKASLPIIARSLRQDHTTILHAIRRMEAKVHAEWEFAERLRLIEQRIRIELGELKRPVGCVGRYVPIEQMQDYLLIGWLASPFNEHAAVVTWPCSCRCVEPKA